MEYFWNWSVSVFFGLYGFYLATKLLIGEILGVPVHSLNSASVIEVYISSCLLYLSILYFTPS